ADDRIVDQDDAFAIDQIAHRIEFDAYTKRTDRLPRLDECATDVVITHEPETKTQSTLRRVTDRRRHARVRHGHYDVSISRLFDREPASHLVSRLIDRFSVNQRIRTR